LALKHLGGYCYSHVTSSHITQNCYHVSSDPEFSDILHTFHKSLKDWSNVTVTKKNPHNNKKNKSPFSYHEFFFRYCNPEANCIMGTAECKRLRLDAKTDTLNAVLTWKRKYVAMTPLFRCSLCWQVLEHRIPCGNPAKQPFVKVTIGHLNNYTSSELLRLHRSTYSALQSRSAHFRQKGVNRHSNNYRSVNADNHDRGSSTMHHVQFICQSITTIYEGNSKRNVPYLYEYI